MGGGYSNQFVGTAGAIGENRDYQMSLLEAVPVRSKPKGIEVGAIVGGGVVVTAHKLKLCFCCGNYSLPIGTVNEICLICGWIDDEFQNKHPDSASGRNAISLNEARARFQYHHK